MKKMETIWVITRLLHRVKYLKCIMLVIGCVLLNIHEPLS